MIYRIPAAASNQHASAGRERTERGGPRKISNTVRLAAVYAAIGGGTTTASGQSRRACRPPIALRTPCAFAS